ncbi:hypothetical protein JTB14_023997 [Gonioctena quinquepunctata]|nr:hypothetical protein JTB14_023997 [Gonioctena quinquepunctata]
MRREKRLPKMRSYINNQLSQGEDKTETEHSLRLDTSRNRSALVVLHETPEERINRLSVTRQAARERRNQFDADILQKAMNVYADVPCSICKKKLYPQQRVKLQTSNFDSIWPGELLALGDVVSCSRCSNYIKEQNTPPQAYWNNIVVPFLRKIKVRNRLSQDWCKRQAIIFARDVVELAKQFSLEPNRVGLVLVVESRENLRHSVEFQIYIGELQLALQWLLTKNALYEDVRLYFPTVFDISTITQIADEPTYANEKPIAERSSVPTNKYTASSVNVSLLHGFFHQGNERFSPESRGRQCTGIATVACMPQDLQTSIIVQQSPHENNNHIEDRIISQLPSEEDILDPQSLNRNTETRYIFTTRTLRNIDEGELNLDIVITIDNPNPEGEVKLQERSYQPYLLIWVPSEVTLCLDPDEALANNGRFCISRTTAQETMINNYSLNLWKGNMDIQPCGNISAVAYYVAKYASRCEPHDTGDVVRQAITKAKRRHSLIVCHIPFRDENQLMLGNEIPESCFLGRKDELKPLFTYVITQEFAHAEQFISPAIAQATALNVARETRSENIRDDLTINADENINQYQDDSCEDVEERGAMTDDIFSDNI